MILLPIRLCVHCITLFRPNHSTACDQNNYCCLRCERTWMARKVWN